MGSTKRVTIQPGLHVNLFFGPGGFFCRWDPDIPKPITKWQQRRYLAERDRFLKGLSIEIGDIIIIDWRGTHLFNRGRKETVSREFRV